MNLFSKITKPLNKITKSLLDPLGNTIDDTKDLLGIGGKKKKKNAPIFGKTEPTIPDYGTLRLAALRRAAKRGGGRVSTILSRDA